jgi:hypothetical protein
MRFDGSEMGTCFPHPIMIVCEIIDSLATMKLIQARLEVFATMSMTYVLIFTSGNENTTV